jgi:metallo-beta-lactamase family protein
MKITFLGGAGTVTGSKFLVKTGGRKLLVDCGLFQGYKQLRLRNWNPLPVKPSDIDAVLLTHAHLDHSGYLPLLVKSGFKGKIHCTEATRELCAILLPDSGYLQEEDAAYANRKGFSKHSPALPLYTRADGVAALDRFAAIPFHKSVALGGGVEFTLRRAGHILGAAFIELRAEGRTVVFSGDVGRPADPIMRPPELPDAADLFVVESTYGDRAHPAEEPRTLLAAAINRAAARGGSVLIPAFAVGRSQALLHLLAQLKAERRIPDLPVYLNSPMAVNATEIYHRHAGEHRLTPAECAAACSVARMVKSEAESRALNAMGEPRVIISAAGMLTGGRVLHHLKAMAPDERNLILLSGFQAGGTRGAALATGAAEVKIHGKYVPVKAEVAQLHSISAHADRTELLQWMGAFPAAPKRVLVVHGEPAAADALRLAIQEKLKWRADVPALGESVELA